MREPFHTLIWKASVGYNDSWSRVDPEVLEKFAELIVKECADIAKNSQYRGASSDYYDGFNEALVYSANKIKEHFGVER